MDKDEFTDLVIGNKILYINMDGNVIPISSDQVIEIDDPVPEGNRWRSIALHYRADEGRTSWIWAPAGPGLTADSMMKDLGLTRAAYPGIPSEVAVLVAEEN